MSQRTARTDPVSEALARAPKSTVTLTEGEREVMRAYEAGELGKLLTEEEFAREVERIRRERRALDR